MARIKRVLRKVTPSSPTQQVGKEDFGAKGAPLNTQHPFYFGFLAASGALVAITVLRALQSASQVFVLIIISLFLAMGLNPTVEALQARKLKRGSAVAIVVASALLLVSLFVLVVIPPVFTQANELIDGAPQLIDALRNNSTLSELNSQYGVIDTLEKKFQSLISDGQIFTGAFGGVVGVGRTVLSGAFSALNHRLPIERKAEA